MKRIIGLCGLFLGLGLLGAPCAHAGSATLNIFTSTSPANPGGATVAAPASGFFISLQGCVFSNGYSAGECATISSSVTGEPSFELCAPSTTTVMTPAPMPVQQARGQSGLAALFGSSFLYSGSLTVTGTATQSNILLTCGYRITDSLGR